MVRWWLGGGWVVFGCCSSADCMRLGGVQVEFRQGYARDMICMGHPISIRMRYQNQHQDEPPTASINDLASHLASRVKVKSIPLLETATRI